VKYGPARVRYERRKRRRQRLQAYTWLWNLLTVLFGFATLVVGVWFIWRLASPQAVKAQQVLPTESVQTVDGPTVATLEVPIVVPSKQSIKVTPTKPVPTPEDESLFTFDLQARPDSISATLFKQERTCNWSGIAGQVFDLQGRSIPGITVQVSGPMYGKDIQFLSITGSATWYGAGGYEIFLTDKPVDTQGEYQVRLVDQTGRGLSPRFSFNTSSDCAKNLVIVNFKQIK
jgi:hypothetical protein